MKRMSKAKILAMNLADFGIKPLTNWMKRFEEVLQARVRYWAERCANPSISPTNDKSDNPQEQLEQAKQRLASAPKNVAGLIQFYPYLFRHKWYTNGSRNGTGLGQKPIEQLKGKLLDLGLTPDDWPALAHHDKLLEKLSKKTILTLPITVLFVLSGRRYELDGYLGCKQEELGTKTVKDFISIDPFQSSDDLYSPGTSFFKHRRRQFVALRQKLIAKGFTVKDGVFFKWNPEPGSLEKARWALKKYDLTAEETRKLAEIAVTERWVI